jgi:hypothetical protein
VTSSVIKATGTIELEDVVDVGAQVMGRIEDLGWIWPVHGRRQEAQATGATRSEGSPSGANDVGATVFTHH